MKLGLVAAWKKIAADHKQLSDKRFRPDLGPLLAKYETDFDEQDDLHKQLDAIKSGFVPYLKAAAEARTETKNQLEDARKQLVDQFGADWQKFFNDYGDGSDWEVVQKACNTYTTAQKKFIAAVDSYVKQLTQQRDTSAKGEQTAFTQYLTKRTQVEAKQKKVLGELSKLQDEIPQVIGTYIKIAKQMKDDDLADDINSILRKLPVPA
ncbi:MAG TPA: hypothetical protein VLI90_03765 [Tepidisphaeraceae bacterium]|nr:hypothetical protein [Tepidisphaeraceae bacterium]